MRKNHEGMLSLIIRVCGSRGRGNRQRESACARGGKRISQPEVVCALEVERLSIGRVLGGYDTSIYRYHTGILRVS